MSGHDGEMGKQISPPMGGGAKALWPSDVDQTPV